ncbi:M1 family metallopeptidase [Pontibacter qinzhouensis]|uniref:Aminopeptidase N n=1 Tax=Pontibacter qinzhouensis TaxID=2603253 RepID=A0A5C8KEG5_9BACT|nr:M1 family aminopeptidase [Pontibacter qinzhouensis]TXK50814.1 M1 family metallopeptidase [Pontibacter qinzhouensis]
MNHRFLSTVGLAAMVAVSAGCSSSKSAVNTSESSLVITDTAPDTASVPVWAPKKHSFNPSRTRHHDLLHTKLRLRFDWEKQHVLGLAELTLKPYFYPQQQLVLDAKGFDIHSIHLMKGFDGTPLKYAYDGMKLTVELGRTFTRDEKYVIEINYTAKPNELAAGGSDAITDDKGLYFINPLGTEPDKPRQIWTQGETEASSAWFPTIDSPNERMTQDVYLTVEKNFTTLSNGTFVYSRQNPDGTKTDYWKMEQPHAPYLAMVAIGEFAVVKDKWRDKEVNYYVEPAYAPTAKKIFGHTPEMMEFFSKKLGVDFPWAKYAQVVVRDFVSGAMENTTASVFMEDLQLTERELIDKNWDGIIAHELFHQWFGDYVTTESWANLPLNESFANYSEFLWSEHKYGADEAAYLQMEELSQYLAEAETKREPMIRYRYGNREEMFDSHSYAKGGRVLHMLRKYVGDDAFFTSLNHYLTKHKFSDVEIAELRMAFEDVTGEDMMWFFDQWFMNAGHPELRVTHTYENGQLSLQVEQQQDTVYAPVYRLPLKVGVWLNGKRTDYPIEISKAIQTFQFPVAAQPQAVVFDSEQQLLGTIDHAKSDEELIYQYSNVPEMGARYEALTKLEDKLQSPDVRNVMQAALKDDFWYIRSLAVNALVSLEAEEAAAYANEIKQLATSDKKSSVRADAILALAAWGGKDLVPLYEQAMQDSSYQVTAAGILGYAGTGAADTKIKLAHFDKEKNEDVVLSLAAYYAVQGGMEKNDWFVRQVKQARGSGLYYLLQSYGAFLAGNEQANTPEAINLLGDLAMNHNLYYIRLGAYQALGVMSDRQEVKELQEKIKQNEKDERLLNLYSR